MSKPKLVIVMGVSGSGKSTIAEAVARNLHYHFIEADDFHSPENRAHMTAGQPLSDDMREPWIDSLVDYLERAAVEGRHCVLSFSGLRAGHRERIKSTPMTVTTFYLKGTPELIRQRMQKRQGHFMPVALLESQFSALEDPSLDKDTYSLDIDQPIEDLVKCATAIIEQQVKH